MKLSDKQVREISNNIFTNDIIQFINLHHSEYELFLKKENINNMDVESKEEKSNALITAKEGTKCQEALKPHSTHTKGKNQKINM